MRRWTREGRLDAAHRHRRRRRRRRSAGRRRSRDQRDSDVRLVGVFDDRGDDRAPQPCAGLHKLGTVDDLVEFARRTRVDLVIFSLPISAEGRILQMLKKLWVLPVDIRLSAHTNKLRFRPRSYSYIGNVPVLDVFDRPIADWDVVMKWLFDKIVGGLALLARAARDGCSSRIAIKLDSRGPVLFKQKRYGFNNELIEVYKFRSMYVDMTDHRCRRASPRTIRASPASAASSARPASTSCRSSSTWCSRATCRWSARGRTRCTPEGREPPSTTRRSTAISPATGSSPASPAGRRSTAGAARLDTPEKIQRRVEHDLYYIENWSVLFDLYILAKTPFALLEDRKRLLMIARSTRAAEPAGRCRGAAPGCGSPPSGCARCCCGSPARAAPSCSSSRAPTRSPRS